MFYLVDKPVGPSSNQTLLHIRRMFGAKKAGFAGTLDPLANWLLLVATNGSTKLLSLLDGLDKTYRFVFDLTRTSDSLDLWTEPSPLDPEHPIFKLPPSEAEIHACLNQFIGEINQIPPTYSAIWINGKRAYAEARKWEEVVLPSRRVHISSLQLIRYDFPFIELEADVSSGTYIRSLARDVGHSLGATGLVVSLKRTRIWHLKLADEMEYYETRTNEFTGILEASYDDIFPWIERVDLNQDEYTRVSHGNPIPLQRINTETPDPLATDNHLSIGYFLNTPTALLKKVWCELRPIRMGI